MSRRGYGQLGLRVQVSVVFGGLILLLTLLLSWSLGRVAGRELEAMIGAELAELAFNMSDKFNRGMYSRSAEIDLLAELDVLTDPSDPRPIRTLLDRIQSTVPQFTWMGYLSPDGTVLASTGGVIEGVNIAHRPVYTEGLRGLFVGDVHEAVMLAKALPPSPTGEPLRFVDLARPVHGEDGVVGILAAHLSWDWAREIEDSLIGDLSERRDVEMFILDRNNQVLLAPTGSPLLSDPSGEPATLPQALTGGPERPDEGWSIRIWPDGKRYVTGYSRDRGYKTYPGLDWTVVTRSRVKTALAPIDRLRVLTVNLGILMAVGFAGLAWVVAGRVSRPLRRITEAADGLRHGAVGAKLPFVGGSREVEHLSGSLRALVAALTATDNQRAKMETLALRDALTGLPNRAALRAHLDALSEEANVAAERGGGGAAETVLAFLYLDLDGFKRVNDTLGHDAGDVLLQRCAERLRNCLREGDLAIRLGGDEFVLLVHAGPDDWGTECQKVAQRVIDAISEPVVMGNGAEATVGTSIGIAAWPLDADGYGEVMHLADRALYAVKRSGKGKALFWRDIEDAGE